MADSDWKTVDVQELPEGIRTRYDAMKAQYRAYKAAKDEFEQMMQAAFEDSLPENTELKFGYNFGKLSVAIGPKREQKAKKKEDKGGLGDWLQAQAQGGHRS